MPSIQARIDQTLRRIADMGAKPREIVLLKADFEELTEADPDAKTSYKGVPVREEGIDQPSFIAADGTPSGSTEFAI